MQSRKTVSPASNPFLPPRQRSRKFIYIAVILVVLVFILGLYLTHRNRQLTPSTIAVAPPPTAEVTITDSDFIPKSLLIKPTTKITWRNAGNTNHQVSIDTYRGDSKTPVLSKGLAIRVGDQYLLQFNQVGTYLYSDPLHPEIKGSIEVKN